MNIILKTLSIISLCICTYATAQTTPNRWSPLELQFQNRILHTGMGYQSFDTQIDVGIGLNKKLRLQNWLYLSVGLTANYAQFKSESEGILFISTFKNTDIHYFSHNAVKQLSLEIPIGVALSLFTIRDNPIHFTTAILPQFGLYTAHEGQRWDTEATVKENLFSKDDPYFTTSLLTDLYARAGFSYTFNKHTIRMETGAEYSGFGKSFGLYTKVAFSFK